MIPLGRLLIIIGALLGLILTIVLIKPTRILLKGKKLFGKREKRIRLLGTSLLMILTIGLSAGAITLLYLGAPRLQYWLYDSGPYLTWGPNQEPSNGITVSWHSAIYSTGEILYGTEIDNLIYTVKDKNFAQIHHIRLDNLQPNTTYYYKIKNQNFGIKQFTTSPLNETDFTVVFWSDPRTNNPIDSAKKGALIEPIILNQLKEEGIDPAFSICGGDITSRGVDFETWKLWFDDISTQDFASNRSHVVSCGNHERHDDIGARNFKMFYPYEENPRKGSFSFSFDYAQVHFVMLDPWDVNNPWWGNNTDIIARWLEQDLQKQRNTKFTIISIHPNPILNDKHSGNGTAIMEIARQYNVDAILCGHWHTYDAKYFNGTNIEPKIITNNTENILMQQVPNVVLMAGLGGNSENPNYAGYVTLNFNSSSCIIQTRMIDGKIISTFLIRK